MHSAGMQAFQQAFVHRRGASLVAQDISWAIFFTIGSAGGFFKWLQGGRTTAAALPAFAAYQACCPALLCIIHFCPAWYVRRRTRVLFVVKTLRTLLFYWHLARWEGIYMGYQGSALATVPHGGVRVFTHLAWKVLSLLVAAFGFILPWSAHVPFQLLILTLQLRATAERCLAECGSGGTGVLSAAPLGVCPALPGAAAAASALGLRLAGRCSAAEGRLLRTWQFYGTAVHRIRRVVPLARLLPDSWRQLEPNSCLHSCYAVHAWLQATIGALLPLALLWAWEERLRMRELAKWLCSLQQQREQRQGQQATQGARRDAPSLGSMQAKRPLSFGVLLGWCLASSWLLWVLLEVALVTL